MVNWKYKCLFIFSFVLASCSQEFDSQKWKEANDPADKTRYSMVADLIESKILLGKDRNQVEMLLGDAPNMVEGDSLNLYYRVWDYYGAQIDPVKSYGLHIQLNKEGRVSMTEVQKWK